MVLKIISVFSSYLTRWLDSKLWLSKSIVYLAPRKCLPACHCGFCPVSSPIGFRGRIRSSIRRMSSKNYSSVDKEMIPETEVRQVELPNAVEDMYGGVTVSVEQSMDSTVFLYLLRASLSKWKQQGKKGIWIKLPLEQANLVEVTVREGFRYHHAEPDYLMLVKWISDTLDTIPINASHRVGIGAFVMNSNREVLVVQEKSGPFKGTGVWKLPTGVVDEGEDICAAAIREVREETGIDAEFVEVLAFRQSHKSFFGKSDLFFLCMLRPRSYDIQMQDSELEAAQWMPIAEYAAQSFNKRNEMFNYVAQICVTKSEKDYPGFSPVSATTGSGKISYLYFNRGSGNE